MKYFKFALSMLLTIAVFYGLNTKFGDIPPIGKFLNPSEGIWQNDHNESITGEVQIDGLSDKVTVHYDEHLIPHLFAKNDADLYKAQVTLPQNTGFGKWSFKPLPLPDAYQRLSGKKRWTMTGRNGDAEWVLEPIMPWRK